MPIDLPGKYDHVTLKTSATEEEPGLVIRGAPDVLNPTLGQVLALRTGSDHKDVRHESQASEGDYPCWVSP